MLKKVLLAFGLLIVAFCVVIALQPSEFRITRSAMIPAPVESVFPHVNDLQKWQAWSPWARMDPNCKVTFEGPISGAGAIFSWAGNDQVGTGRMSIVESKPNERIQFKLEFMKPFESKCDTVFGFRSEGAGTEVSWTMTGTNDFMGKAFSLLINCDKMIGGQFEDGFTNLKAVIASTAK
jgi:uncharacterized protein YndB with AHSA1/START domain